MLTRGVTIGLMAIKSSKNADTKALHALRRVARWVNVETVALRKLRMMEAAAVLDDLRVLSMMDEQKKCAKDLYKRSVQD